jgi:hypothetical protein
MIDKTVLDVAGDYIKVHPCTDTEAPYGPYLYARRGIALPFHDHGTKGREGSASRSGRSLLRERPGTHCT